MMFIKTFQTPIHHSASVPPPESYTIYCIIIYTRYYMLGGQLDALLWIFYQ